MRVTPYEGTLADPSAKKAPMTHHHLHSSPETCHWGFFEAKLKPVLTIASGDEVTIDTISGGPDVVPDRSQFHVPPELDEVHANNERMVPGHILTGPIAVEGAVPGDVLEVEILDVKLRQDWGYNLIRPLSGTLPDDFHETRLLNIPLDRERMVGRMPWGLDLPLKPFFGVMGVSPPPAWGRITSLIPRAMGGNLDNKELGAGAKLYLPVFVPGALFSCGDGHGVQGDGEVCVTAIETALQGRFRLTLRKDLRLDYPRAETPDHYMTMAMDPDLDQCVVRALRDMIVLLGEKRNLSREDAYTLCSLAADLRVTQTVNGSKGIHCMIAKGWCTGDSRCIEAANQRIFVGFASLKTLRGPSQRRLQRQLCLNQHAGLSNQRGSVYYCPVGRIGPHETAGESRPPNSGRTPTGLVCWLVVSSPRHLPRSRSRCRCSRNARRRRRSCRRAAQ